MRACARGEAGQVSVVVIGFLVVLGLMVVVVVDASAAFLQHQRLDSAADGAALAATRALRQEDVYLAADRLDLEPADVRAVVTRYVAATGERGVSVDVRVDGDTVRVTLRRVVDLPLTPPGWSGTSMLESTSTARLEVAR